MLYDNRYCMQRLSLNRKTFCNEEIKTTNDGEMCYALVKLYQTQNWPKFIPISVFSEKNFKMFSNYEKDIAKK